MCPNFLYWRVVLFNTWIENRLKLKNLPVINDLEYS